MTRLLPLLIALPLLGADDANELIKRLIAADKRNWERASQYTYIRQADYFEPQKNGPPKKDRSETYEVIFVEGESYQKLVARNDRPLDPKEQAKIEKNMQRTAEERRKQRRSGLLHRTVTLASYNDLLTLFENRFLPDEEVRGHKTSVVLCSPKPGHVPANSHEKDALSFEQKLWIDQAEGQLVRSIFTVVGSHAMLMPGSTITSEFDKINGDVWLEVSSVIDGHLQFAKFIKPAVRTEYTHSKFQKFDVQSTITIDPRN
jgi:hypothetical protein